jgi:hypothetical protein
MEPESGHATLPRRERRDDVLEVAPYDKSADGLVRPDLDLDVLLERPFLVTVVTRVGVIDRQAVAVDDLRELFHPEDLAVVRARFVRESERREEPHAVKLSGYVKVETSDGSSSSSTLRGRGVVW